MMNTSAINKCRNEAMPETKNKGWHTIWKAIFRVSLWCFFILFVGSVLAKWIDHLNDVLFPLSLLIVIIAPAFIVSVFALLIIRGREPENR
jgi:hypothetical protein